MCVSECDWCWSKNTPQQKFVQTMVVQFGWDVYSYMDAPCDNSAAWLIISSIISWCTRAAAAIWSFPYSRVVLVSWFEMCNCCCRSSCFALLKFSLSLFYTPYSALWLTFFIVFAPLRFPKMRFIASSSGLQCVFTVFVMLNSQS